MFYVASTILFKVQALKALPKLQSTNKFCIFEITCRSSSHPSGLGPRVMASLSATEPLGRFSATERGERGERMGRWRRMLAPLTGRRLRTATGGRTDSQRWGFPS